MSSVLPMSTTNQDCMAWMRHARKLEADNERLRKALEDVVKWASPFQAGADTPLASCREGDPQWERIHAFERAKAALYGEMVE